MENFDPQGSVVGGTMVYLRVKNHSMTPSLNKVFIGPVINIFFLYIYIQK